MRRLLALAVLVVTAAATVACDPCAAMSHVHIERCNDGDAESCAWLSENGVTPSGHCTAG
jgi:hypothetical protein